MKRISVQRIINDQEYYAQLTRSNWSAIIQPSGTGENYWPKLFQYFPEYQIFYETPDKDWLGFANTIPVCYSGNLNDLPEEGWDWLIESGIKGFENNIQPNLLGGLQIGINPKYRGQGWSKYLLEQAKNLVTENNLEGFILPIRPTLKDQHPEVSMEEYMTWKKNGKPYDPWIRTHLNAGAQIIKVCHNAMTVEGTVSEWVRWTNQSFTSSGKYKIEGGLSLVEINLEKNSGLYLEPNIWIHYPKIEN